MCHFTPVQLGVFRLVWKKHVSMNALSTIPVATSPPAGDLIVAAYRERHLEHPLLATTVKPKNLVSISDTGTSRPVTKTSNAVISNEQQTPSNEPGSLTIGLRVISR